MKTILIILIITALPGCLLTPTQRNIDAAIAAEIARQRAAIAATRSGGPSVRPPIPPALQNASEASPTVTPNPGPLGNIPGVGQIALYASLLLGGAVPAAAWAKRAAKKTDNTVDDAVVEVVHDGITYISRAGEFIGIRPAEFRVPGLTPTKGP